MCTSCSPWEATQVAHRSNTVNGYGEHGARIRNESGEDRPRRSPQTFAPACLVCVTAVRTQSVFTLRLRCLWKADYESKMSDEDNRYQNIPCLVISEIFLCEESTRIFASNHDQSKQREPVISAHFQRKLQTIHKEFSHKPWLDWSIGYFCTCLSDNPLTILLVYVSKFTLWERVHRQRKSAMQASHFGLR